MSDFFIIGAELDVVLETWRIPYEKDMLAHGKKMLLLRVLYVGRGVDARFWIRGISLVVSAALKEVVVFCPLACVRTHWHWEVGCV